MIRFALSLLAVFFTLTVAQAQDSKPIKVSDTEAKQKLEAQIKAIQTAIDYFEKNPNKNPELADPTEIKIIKKAIETKTFDQYVASLKPIWLQKKNRKGAMDLFMLQPDYLVLQNIGLGLLANNQENLSELYADLFEDIPTASQPLFVAPDKVKQMSAPKIMVELKKLTQWSEKQQTILDQLESLKAKSFHLTAVPSQNCSTEIGHDPVVGDGSNWCDRTEFHPQSLLGFSKLAADGQITCVRHQGNRGTCSSFTINAALETVKTRTGENRGHYNLSEQFTYFYGEVKTFWGRYDYGINVENAFNEFKNSNQRIPFENRWRYNPSMEISETKNSSNQFDRSCRSYIGQMCTNFAFQGRERDLGWGFFEFTHPNMSFTNAIRPRSITTISTFWSMEDALDTVISLVHNKKPIVASFMVRTNFDQVSNHGRVQKESNDFRSNQNLGDHAALIIGFVRNGNLPEHAEPANEKGYFIMKNSWGTDHGDCGFFYVDYAYMKAYANSFWRIRAY